METCLPARTAAHYISGRKSGPEGIPVVSYWAVKLKNVHGTVIKGRCEVKLFFFPSKSATSFLIVCLVKSASYLQSAVMLGNLSCFESASMRWGSKWSSK